MQSKTLTQELHSNQIKLIQTLKRIVNIHRYVVFHPSYVGGDEKLSVYITDRYQHLALSPVTRRRQNLIKK